MTLKKNSVKGLWAVVKTQNGKHCIPVKIESNKLDITFYGWAFGERLHEYSRSAIMITCETEEAANDYIKSICDENGIIIKESNESGAEDYSASSLESLNDYASGLGDACKDLKPGDGIIVKGYYVERSDDGQTYYVWSDLNESAKLTESDDDNNRDDLDIKYNKLLADLDWLEDDDELNRPDDVADIVSKALGCKPYAVCEVRLSTDDYEDVDYIDKLRDMLIKLSSSSFTDLNYDESELKGSIDANFTVGSEFGIKLVIAAYYSDDSIYLYFKSKPDAKKFVSRLINAANKDISTNKSDNEFDNIDSTSVPRNNKNMTVAVIPDGVTSIGDRAFQYCINLKSVTIPDSVTSIGERAFELCKSLTSITIGDGVTSIGYCAFYHCESLESVTIPNSVKTIGNSAFGGCKNLTNIYIPNSVTHIGDEAFYFCKSIKSMTIPSSVTSIGRSAFGYCDDNLVINCSKGSYAEKYAKENNISVSYLNESITEAEQRKRISYRGYIIRPRKSDDGELYYDIIKPKWSTTEPIWDWCDSVEEAKQWIDSDKDEPFEESKSVNESNSITSEFNNLIAPIKNKYSEVDFIVNAHTKLGCEVVADNNKDRDAVEDEIIDVTDGTKFKYIQSADKMNKARGHRAYVNMIFDFDDTSLNESKSINNEGLIPGISSEEDWLSEFKKAHIALNKKIIKLKSEYESKGLDVDHITSDPRCQANFRRIERAESALRDYYYVDSENLKSIRDGIYKQFNESKSIKESDDNNLDNIQIVDKACKVANIEYDDIIDDPSRGLVVLYREDKSFDETELKSIRDNIVKLSSKLTSCSFYEDTRKIEFVFDTNKINESEGRKAIRTSTVYLVDYEDGMSLPFDDRDTAIDYAIDSDAKQVVKATMYHFSDDESDTDIDGDNSEVIWTAYPNPTTENLEESLSDDDYLYCQACITDDIRDYLTDDELAEISDYIGSDGTIINCESGRCDIRFSDEFVVHQIPVEYLEIELNESKSVKEDLSDCDEDTSMLEKMTNESYDPLDVYSTYEIKNADTDEVIRKIHTTSIDPDDSSTWFDDDDIINQYAGDGIIITRYDYDQGMLDKSEVIYPEESEEIDESVVIETGADESDDDLKEATDFKFEVNEKFELRQSNGIIS